MSKEWKRGIFMLGILLIAAAVLVLVLLLSNLFSLQFTVVVQGEGTLVLTGKEEAALSAGKHRFSVKAGDTFTLTANGDAYFTVGGVRMSAEDALSVTVPDRNLTVGVTFEEVSFGFSPLTADAVVAEAQETGSSAVRPFFPAVTQAEDGTVLVVYYSADGHALYHQSEGKLSGVLCLVRSTDGGKTWSRPQTLVDLTDEDRENGDFNREARDPNLQRLSDGTVILTFPVRAPIGKAGYNGSALNDYWSERTYYMISRDNGKTWSEMRPVECDYFSAEPFLYDDPTRTTGTWVKNGSMAELSGGELLIPLYGAKTCNTRADYTGVVVKAKLAPDGTLTFLKDWAKDENGAPTDAALVLPRGQGNELALCAGEGAVYALARTAIPSRTAGGVVYRSLDGGVTWEEYALEKTGNDCLNQPSFAPLGGDLVLVNYSVPLASVYDSPARRTARPVYAKLFNTKTGNWTEYDAVCLYDTESATVADMANPASVLLSDGRILTVFYDTSAPAHRAGFIGVRFTVLTDYLSQTSPSLEQTVQALLS